LATPAGEIDKAAMFKFSYGLFILTAREGNKDNGCIINTGLQLTDNPKRVSIAVNRTDYTHDMIVHTGMFNISILSQEAQMDQFKWFGFQSGKDVDKFASNSPVANAPRSANGVRYIDANTNAFISCKVVGSHEYGTHTLFIGEVTEAKSLSKTPSATYQYYFDHIKPKPALTQPKKKGWRCTICGYFIEMEGELPADFVCPLCKHGKEVFERVE
jgi:flavin reductase (DIM6/NTAB) family NADH-FMN oxidoreductase RutF